MQLEGEATARAIRLADFVNVPLYVVHVMSTDAMEEVAKARKKGSKFTSNCRITVSEKRFTGI